MATMLDTSAAAKRLHDALNAKVRTAAFGDERFGLFEPLRLRLGAANADFALRPAHGTSSPAYDPVIASFNAATTLVAASVPQPGQDRAAMIRSTGTATDALIAATAAPGILASLRGSLRLGGAASNVGGAKAPTTIAVATDDAPPPPTKAGDPNYYQKLTNLFPAEALALYGTGVALFAGANAFVVLGALVVLLVLRWFANQPAGGGTPHFMAIAVAAVSYLLWATASDPNWLKAFATLDTVTADQIRRGAAFIGAAVVLLAPLLVRAPPAEA